MKLAHNIKFLFSIAVGISLSACMIDPVQTTYTPSVAGYQSASLSSSSLVASNAASVVGTQTAPSTAYSSLSQSEAPIIQKGALFTGSIPAAPARLNSAPLIGVTPAIQTTSYGIPVTINNPAQTGASPYGALSATDQQIIRPNVFGMPQQAVPVYQQPAYGQGYPIQMPR
jgi:hypothetical protein